MTTIAHQLVTISDEIQRLEKQYGRPSHSVHLLAVSKGQSLDKIQQAIDAGQTAFGENYLQEALPKIAAFSHLNLEWHFIGPIQSNKTKKIAENFDWVQSVSSLQTAQRLNDQRPLGLPVLNICLQVNISEEDTKSGLAADDTLEVAKCCAELPRIKLRGLMTIPAIKSTLHEQRAEYHKLHLLYEHLISAGFFLDTLSMGMSHDMHAAIAEGSTLVRIGTNLFGSRS